LAEEAEEPQRKGWGFVVLFLLLHAALGVRVSTLSRLLLAGAVPRDPL